MRTLITLAATAIGTFASDPCNLIVGAHNPLNVYQFMQPWGPTLGINMQVDYACMGLGQDHCEGCVIWTSQRRKVDEPHWGDPLPWGGQQNLDVTCGLMRTEHYQRYMPNVSPGWVYRIEIGVRNTYCDDENGTTIFIRSVEDEVQ